MTTLPTIATTAKLLIHLGSLVGATIDTERAQSAVRTAMKPGMEPMELFTVVARDLFMHADSEWVRFDDAIWRSRGDTPVVMWSEKKQSWIVVTYAGWYRVRVTDSDEPNTRRTISRRELKDWLGVSKDDERIETTVIDPQYHAAKIRHDPEEHESELTPFKRFCGLLACERQDIIYFLIYSLFAAVLYLGGPLAVDAVVSGLAFGAVESPYLQALVVVAIAFAVSLVLHGLINAFLFYISEMIQRRVFVRTAADMANRLPRMDVEKLDEEHVPEVVNRFFDIVTLQKSISVMLLEVVNLVFSGGFGMLLLALYHPYLMIIAALLGLSILVVLKYLGNGGERTAVNESRYKYQIVSCFEEIGHFPYLFKGPGGRDFAAQRANQLVTGYIHARSQHFKIVMRQIGGLLVIQVVAGTALLIVGGYLVLKQEITLGQLVASEIIMSGIVSSIGKLGKKVEAWYDAMAAMDKIGHIMDLPVEREGGEASSKAVVGHEGYELELQQVGYAYPDSHQVFEAVDTRIEAGQRVAIVGPHGSGASTLLDVLFGSRVASEGYVTVNRLDLREWALDAYRREAQMIRRNEFVAGGVMENLRLGRDDIGADEIVSALDRVGMVESLRQRADGLGLQMQLGGAPLSGMQRARLLLARALVQRPKLLLVDELLDGMDEETLAIALPILFDRDQPWTVVIATREPQVIERCDQVIRLGKNDLFEPANV